MHCSHGAQQPELGEPEATKEVAADLCHIYTAASVDEASAALDQFALKWDATYPQIAKSSRNQ